MVAALTNGRYDDSVFGVLEDRIKDSGKFQSKPRNTEEWSVLMTPQRAFPLKAHRQKPLVSYAAEWLQQVQDDVP